MATGKLTKRTVDAQQSGDKDTYLWDAGHIDALSGFGLKVTPAGRKVYLIQYRLGGRKGRTRRFTIGTHGKITAEEARTRAKTLLGEVAAGNDLASACRYEAEGAIRSGISPRRPPLYSARAKEPTHRRHPATRHRAPPPFNA
jgi:hypothetical protein